MESNSFLSEGSLLKGGKYRIVRLLSQGRFVCTYEAVVIRGNKRVVIKEFFPREIVYRNELGNFVYKWTNLVDYYIRLRRAFVDGAQKLKSFSKVSGMACVTDVFDWKDSSYCVINYVEGQSLGDVIAKYGAMPESVAVYVIRLLGKTIEQLHAHGWLHLRLRPNNVKFDSFGRTIIINSGLSKQVDHEYAIINYGEPDIMSIGDGFYAFEVFGGDPKLLYPTTDVYSLGAILYAMLAGKNPPVSIDIAAGEKEIEWPSGISVSVSVAIKNAMALSRKKRTTTVADFLAMLPVYDAIDRDWMKRCIGCEPKIQRNFFVTLAYKLFGRSKNN